MKSVFFWKPPAPVIQVQRAQHKKRYVLKSQYTAFVLYPLTTRQTRTSLYYNEGNGLL